MFIRMGLISCFFFFSSRRRHTRCREVSWARRCVQETGINAEYMGLLGRKGSMVKEAKIATKKVKQFLIVGREKPSEKNPNPKVYRMRVFAVSYTHLTLPTILLVQISVVAVSLKKKKKVKSTA
eukprot:TRINITY_DN7052_c0_g1_i5.p2 TRINITY_DN7052_c0_g1~~TRINITY_DN7052_c0_g1_i5.p2  ORF type:complete len:124 (-),score=58.26 TRINITY_DN7052_c0_g1_i5:82-453(-)